jgi:hypothetical protein
LPVVGGLYYGGGFGYYHLQTRGGATPDSKGAIGGEVLIGAHLAANAFIEANYRFSGSFGGTKTDSVNAMLGFKF